jgi:Flp pilus assembly protein TadD
MTRVAAKPIAIAPGFHVALLGQRVAFTGRLATLTRGDAEALVARAAGRLAPSVLPRATMLVVGMRGWPLMDSGQLPRKLAEAEAVRAAGKPLRILSETQFRELVGLEAVPDGSGKSLSPEQVCATVGIDAQTLRRWEHCGLVRPHDGLYDFRDLVSLRTVSALVNRGVSAVVIRASLDALGRFLPGVERPLAQLNMLVSDRGELAAEVEQALLTPSGQLEMRFDAPRPPADDDQPSLVIAAERGSAAWIDEGLEQEESGDLARAEQAYRRAAAISPQDAMPRFNLGNVLLAAGRLRAAAQHFEQAVALDAGHARAWFNLAHVSDQLGDQHAAIAHLRRAIAADSAYADAYFNLGDLAERLGDEPTARGAWEGYLRLDPASEWGVQARTRLRKLRQPPEGPAWA